MNNARQFFNYLESFVTAEKLSGGISEIIVELECSLYGERYTTALSYIKKTDGERFKIQSIRSVYSESFPGERKELYKKIKDEMKSGHVMYGNISDVITITLNDQDATMENFRYALNLMVEEEV